LPVRAYLYFLRVDQAIEITQPLSWDLLERYQSANEYPVNAGAHCAKCKHAGGACPVAPPLN
jgi:hypothetical protein